MSQRNPNDNPRLKETREANAGEQGAPEAASQSLRTGTPRSLGAYQILGELGRGGMGVVYRAEQANPRRHVALKVIASSLVTPQLLRRFEHESQVLGRLKHVGIAQVYEAGTAEGGHGPQPFFAMELVDGAALDEYLTASRLSVRRRLELFMKICDAVQYAHQQGVIHRDLKPGNILVQSDGQPKILDFGVARATESDVQATTIQTDVGQLIGTLPYMSPEQAGGLPDEIDTRSDVYALGVILYEMLACRLPYDLTRRVLTEAVRVIREEEPSRLSSIDRNLRGDLETIVGKALAKEKDRRYPSASDLAADVQRYLGDQPIAARPPSTWYQFSKFARRNRALVSGLAGTFLALLAGVIVSTAMYWRAELQREESDRLRIEAQTQQRRAKEQADIADAVNQFQQDMLAAADPARMLGDKVTVLQIMQAAVGDLNDGSLKDRPAISAAVRETIGTTLRKLGRYDEAEPLLRDALAISRGAVPRSDSDVSSRLTALAQLLDDTGQFEEAEPLLREALELEKKGPPGQTTDENVGIAQNNLAVNLRAHGKAPEAEQLQREALKVFQKYLPPQDSSIATALNNLALTVNEVGKAEEAEKLFRDALEMRRKVLPSGHPDIGDAASNLADVLTRQNKATEAEALLRESVDICRKTLPANHPSIADNLKSLGSLLLDLGKLSDAEVALREAVEVRRNTPRPNPLLTAVSLDQLARVLREEHKLKEAEPLCTEALDIRPRSVPEDDPSLAPVLSNLSQLQMDQGKLQQAELTAREALRIWRNSNPADSPDVALGTNNLARILHAQERLDEAEVMYRQALEIFRKTLGPDNTKLAGVLSNLAVVLQTQGKFTDAEPMFREALQILTKTLPPNHPTLATVMSNFAVLCENVGKTNEAESLLKKAIDIDAASLPAGHPGTALRMNNLGLLYWRERKLDQAETWLRRALEIERNALPPDHPNLLHCCHDLGVVLLEANKLKDAEPLLQEALALREKKYGPTSAPTTRSADALARLLNRSGRSAEALTLRAAHGLPTIPTTAATVPTTQP